MMHATAAGSDPLQARLHEWHVVLLDRHAIRDDEVATAPRHEHEHRVGFAGSQDGAFTYSVAAVSPFQKIQSRSHVGHLTIESVAR